MKTLVALTASLLSSLALAQTELPTLTWVGQFPKEQALPIIELFNSQYSEKAGFKVVYNSDDAAIAALLSGQTNPSFDLVHMKDAEMLNSLALQNMTEPLTNDSLKSWPSHLKDSNNMWVGLLKRARVIYYNSELVSADEVQTYESLGNEKFKDKLCLRQKKAQYNVGLYAFFVGVWGEEKTKQVLKSWSVNSEALPLIEKDLDGVIANIENGTCLVGVANTYYYIRHLSTNPQSKVKASIPNQKDIGAHVNVDGIAVLNSSSNKSHAQTFAKWLMTEEPQRELSRITSKHAAHPAVQTEELQNAFGMIKENTSFDLNRLTDLKTKGLEIATEQGLK